MFARLLTVAAPTISDGLFQRLREQYGDRKVAAMILLAAYGNFQDRIVLGLNLPMEVDGPLAPLDIVFVDGALQMAPLIPPNDGKARYVNGQASVVPLNERVDKHRIRTVASKTGRPTPSSSQAAYSTMG